MSHTPERNPRAEATAKKILKFGCLPAFVILIAIIVLGSALDDGDDEKPDAKPPAYTVVKQDDSGNKRNVVVEVDTTENLKGVFHAVTKSLSDEAGYSIQINCSTGGTKSVDNRLANGQYAVGRMGAATTGLDEGDIEFAINDDRTCPDTRPSPDWSAARKHAGIPEEPTGADREELLRALAAANPDIVKYEDKAIDAAQNQCSAINDEGVKRIDWLAAQRFTYKDVTTTEAQGKQINEALKGIGFCEV
ncbi:hypothetical protein AB0O68_15660 [Streptomyces sp. NPDC087512]|uniref:hypothetical protein n=1 Tax=Streptomyces sp. NPDC087512 TaxID=3155059 RepID=UPI003412C261